MASILSRERADGGTSHTVRWVIGGGRYAPGKQLGAETFTRLAPAQTFKADVEAAGHQWPEGWVKGKGYATQPETPVDGPTFDDVTRDYYEHQMSRVKLGRLKPYTLHRYRRMEAIHLSSTFGATPFTSINHLDIEDWVIQQVDAGASPKSIRNRHGLLYSILAHGQKRMRVRFDNPCEITELPEVDHKIARQVRFFQHGEWALFRGCLNRDVHLLVDVLLKTGIRWGEASALRVSDITWTDGGAAVIHIVRAWSRRAPDDESPIQFLEGENKSWVIGPPKNKRSRYVVLKGQAAERLRAEIDGHPKGSYVFTTRGGSPWRYPDFHYERWLPAREEARALGLTKHVTPHMLRHTAVVWSLAAGVKIEKISEMLGHASIQITYDIYGGLINLQDEDMADAMTEVDDIVGKAITPRSSEAM
jgi:integrase